MPRFPQNLLPKAFAGLLLSLAVLSFVRPARADNKRKIKLVKKKAKFVWKKKLLRMDLSYREVVDKKIAKRLKSGLPTTIILRAYVFKKGSKKPVALTVKSCRVLYDPWDEVFRIRLAKPGGKRKQVSPTLKGVIRRCAQTKKLPVVNQPVLKKRTLYLVQGLVEVNPISKKMLKRIKNWVSRPAGASAIGAGDALFGSFVGIFVARIGTADRTLRFRTQTFKAPSK